MWSHGLHRVLLVLISVALSFQRVEGLVTCQHDAFNASALYYERDAAHGDTLTITNCTHLVVDGFELGPKSRVLVNLTAMAATADAQGIRQLTVLFSNVTLRSGSELILGGGPGSDFPSVECSVAVIGGQLDSAEVMLYRLRGDAGNLHAEVRDLNISGWGDLPTMYWGGLASFYPTAPIVATSRHGYVYGSIFLADATVLKHGSTVVIANNTAALHAPTAVSHFIAIGSIAHVVIESGSSVVVEGNDVTTSKPINSAGILFPMAAFRLNHGFIVIRRNSYRQLPPIAGWVQGVGIFIDGLSSWRLVNRSRVIVEANNIALLGGYGVWLQTWTLNAAEQDGLQLSDGSVFAIRENLVDRRIEKHPIVRSANFIAVAFQPHSAKIRVEHRSLFAIERNVVRADNPDTLNDNKALIDVFLTITELWVLEGSVFSMSGNTVNVTGRDWSGGSSLVYGVRIGIYGQVPFVPANGSVIALDNNTVVYAPTVLNTSDPQTGVTFLGVILYLPSVNYYIHNASVVSLSQNMVISTAPATLLAYDGFPILTQYSALRITENLLAGCAAHCIAKGHGGYLTNGNVDSTSLIAIEGNFGWSGVAVLDRPVPYPRCALDKTACLLCRTQIDSLLSGLPPEAAIGRFRFVGNTRLYPSQRMCSNTISILEGVVDSVAAEVAVSVVANNAIRTLSGDVPEVYSTNNQGRVNGSTGVYRGSNPRSERWVLRCNDAFGDNGASDDYWMPTKTLLPCVDETAVQEAVKSNTTNDGSGIRLSDTLCNASVDCFGPLTAFAELVPDAEVIPQPRWKHTEGHDEDFVVTAARITQQDVAAVSESVRNLPRSRHCKCHCVAARSLRPASRVASPVALDDASLHLDDALAAAGQSPILGLGPDCSLQLTQSAAAAEEPQSSRTVTKSLSPSVLPPATSTIPSASVTLEAPALVITSPLSQPSPSATLVEDEPASSAAPPQPPPEPPAIEEQTRTPSNSKVAAVLKTVSAQWSVTHSFSWSVPDASEASFDEQTSGAVVGAARIVGTTGSIAVALVASTTADADAASDMQALGLLSVLECAPRGSRDAAAGVGRSFLPFELPMSRNWAKVGALGTVVGLVAVGTAAAAFVASRQAPNRGEDGRGTGTDSIDETAWARGCTAARFPSRPLTVALLAVQGLSHSATALFVEGEAALPAVVTTVLSAVVVAGTAWIQVRPDLGGARQSEKLPTEALEACPQFLRWASATTQWLPKRTRRRFGAAFNSQRPGREWFRLLMALRSAVLGCVAGLKPETERGCTMQRWALGGACLATAAAAVVLAPKRVVGLNGLLGFGSLLVAIALLVTNAALKELMVLAAGGMLLVTTGVHFALVRIDSRMVRRAAKISASADAPQGTPLLAAAPVVASTTPAAGGVNRGDGVAAPQQQANPLQHVRASAQARDALL